MLRDIGTEEVSPARYLYTKLFQATLSVIWTYCVGDDFLSLCAVCIDMPSPLCHCRRVGCWALVSPFPREAEPFEKWYPGDRC
jgi:hypothetical protein